MSGFFGRLRNVAGAAVSYIPGFGYAPAVPAANVNAAAVAVPANANRANRRGSNANAAEAAVAAAPAPVPAAVAAAPMPAPEPVAAGGAGAAAPMTVAQRMAALREKQAANAAKGKTTEEQIKARLAGSGQSAHHYGYTTRRVNESFYNQERKKHGFFARPQTQPGALDPSRIDLLQNQFGYKSGGSRRFHKKRRGQSACTRRSNNRKNTRRSRTQRRK